MNISEASQAYATVLQDAPAPAPAPDAPRGRGRPPKPQLEITDIQKEADALVKKSKTRGRPRKNAIPQPAELIKHLVEPTSDDNSNVAKNQILQRIVLNIQNFGEHLTFIKDQEKYISSLHSKSLEDLQGILDTILSTIQINNLSLQLKQGFFLFSRVSEWGSQELLGLKTNGMTEALLRNQAELSLIMKELAIDLSPKIHGFTRPEMRLGFLFVMTMVQTDQHNRMIEHIHAMEGKAEAKKESLEKKFGDL